MVHMAWKGLLGMNGIIRYILKEQLNYTDLSPLFCNGNFSNLVQASWESFHASYYPYAICPPQRSIQSQ